MILHEGDGPEEDVEEDGEEDEADATEVVHPDGSATGVLLHLQERCWCNCRTCHYE